MNRQGVTLIEFVLAFALLATILTAIILGLNVGIRGGEKVDEQTTALQLTRSQIEFILAQPYNLNYQTISTPIGWELDQKMREIRPNLLQEITVKASFEGKEILSLSVYKANSAYQP